LVYNRLTETEKALMPSEAPLARSRPPADIGRLVPCAQDNRNLEEIWISKAVDANQILLPKKVVQLTGQSFRAVRCNLAKMTSNVRLEGPRNPGE
jgi:hypothetical protein